MLYIYPVNPALQSFVNIAGNYPALLNTVDTALLYGRMSPQTRTAIQAALLAQNSDYERVLTAIYLAVMSGEYLVQHYKVSSGGRSSSSVWAASTRTAGRRTSNTSCSNR